MTDIQIINTINKELASGSSKELITKILEIQGYSQTEIDTAFASIEAPQVPQTELPIQMPVATIPIVEIPAIVAPVIDVTSVINTPMVETPASIPIAVNAVQVDQAPVADKIAPAVNQEQPIALHLENSVPTPNVLIPNVKIQQVEVPLVQSLTSNTNQVQMTSIPPFVVPQQSPIILPTKSHAGIIVSFVIIFLLIIGGTAFAYYKQIGPFSINQYNETSLLSGLLTKSSSINTATYTVSVKLNVDPRDKGATPYIPLAVDKQVEQQYKNDFKRISDVSLIIESLKYKYGEQQVYDFKTNKYKLSKAGSFPAVLSDTDRSGGFYNSSFNSKATTTPATKTGYDPVTNQPYEYKSIDKGKNFSIKVTLETSTALDSIKKGYYYSATSTIIDGNNITFSKDSSYQYISPDMPKPMFAYLSDYLKQISPDVSASILFGATLDIKNPDSPDGSMNVTADGSFGDLSYKVDVEALKKDKDFYFRINKIPAIISFISNLKGQWIKISPATTTAATSTNSLYNYDPVTMFSDGLIKGDAEYRKKRTEFVDTLKNLAQLADKNKLLSFKQTPKREKVDGRNLIRYDLSVKKEAILSFYKEILSNPEKYKNLGILDDQGLLTYLESKEFDNTFAFFQNNTFITIWTDGNGLPAIIEYRMRIVPPDTATQLKDKQVDITFRITMDNINKPINIKVPSDAKPIEKVREEMSKNSN